MSKIHSIEELKQKCAEKNMPLEKMRFFIGEDRKEPKCFGVYQDELTGDWIVYKNKANGERAIRYRGPDEARAAQEIWNKIGSETKRRKDLYASPYDRAVLEDAANRNADVPKTNFLENIIAAIMTPLTVNGNYKYLILAAILGCIGYYYLADDYEFRDGYYQVEDDTYYCINDDWYIYEAGDWALTTLFDGSYEEDVEEYYIGDDYDASYGFSDFTDTGYYANYLADDQYDGYDYDGYDTDGYDYDDYDYDDYDYDDDDDFDFDFWDDDDTDWDTDW